MHRVATLYSMTEEKVIVCTWTSTYAGSFEEKRIIDSIDNPQRWKLLRLPARQLAI